MDKEIFMRSNFKPVALVLALVALLVFAPGAAMAKHGGGGGDASCGSIDNFDMTLGYTDGQPTITWSATTTNLCLDEFTGTTAFNFSNSESGLTQRAVYGQIGTRTYGATFAAKPGVTYTITVQVQSKNKLITSQTKSATGLPAL
jgi:hypothetical protein